MKVRYWATVAKTGEILAELPVTGNASLGSRLGGGTCNVPVSLAHLTLRDGSGIDQGAVDRMYGLVEPGRRSVVATAVHNGTPVVLGEWLIMRHPRSTAADTINLSGMEWSGYPALRYINADADFTDVDQFQIAKWLFERVFIVSNNGFLITIPDATSGVTRSLQQEDRTAYVSDLLDDISAPEDGFQWHVQVTGTFEGDRPTSVQREIIMQSPVFSHGSEIVIEHDRPGSRRGNAVEIGGGDDYARYVQTVMAYAAGEGSKQLWARAEDTTLTQQRGYMLSTKMLRLQHVRNQAHLQALADAAVAAGQDTRDPFTATAWVDKLATQPRVGSLVRLRSGSSYGWPYGLDVQVRVGEVKYSTRRGECTAVDIQAI